ncbi:MAG: zf-HC2 domain-containing protein [Myxococcales bacterium]|nr:zf-HC2 domain-containing protein [Myxococcales bacterium]
MARTQPRVDCHSVEAQMSALLDGALPAVEAEAVNRHFQQCPACARFYQSLREQLVLHRWGADDVFELDDVDECRPGDIPDYGALAARLRAADLEQLGRLLYEILKAEFVYDYGDDLEVSEAPIADPRLERLRGADMAEELRDWHDADELDGVDLRDVQARLARPEAVHDRLDALIRGMAIVGQAAPGLRYHARYYQALGHYKAGRFDEAQAAFDLIAADASPGLARLAEVSSASLPVERGEGVAEALPRLESALRGDALDALVWFNLAKGRFLAAGARATPAARAALASARALDAGLVERQLSRPSERALRLALG